MDQRIGFCPVDGGRVAYAVTGDGPPLVLPAWWVSHLEVDWQFAGFRAFVEALSAHHTVIRYDRLGTGLSDRDRPPEQLTMEHEVGTLEALVDELGVERPALLAVSCAGCIATTYAVRHPVAAIVYASSYADGTRVAPDNVERLMIAAVRTHWGVGSRMLTDVFLAGAPDEERAEYERFQRASATPEMAAELLELVYATDVSDLVPRLDVPALVVNRRGDRAVPFDLGRELASLLPGARFVPLEGRTHLPWSGQYGTIVELILRFLDGDEAVAAAAPPADEGVLSARELEVLRLVATGLNDTQIADALVLSPHTVHRHVANIRTKLRQPTRGAAAAEAARRGLI
ncbi:MAG: alpha/beta fold hydrolase [Actinomycetota bacterium]|nr:alpha/beta fold hydrolase [Actinomycetota bacterium]